MIPARRTRRAQSHLQSPQNSCQIHFGRPKRPPELIKSASMIVCRLVHGRGRRGVRFMFEKHIDTHTG
jgi:hypothetical protein